MGGARACCHPSSAATKGKLEAMKMFQKLQKDLGMEVALESFRKVLGAVKEDIFHDPLGCSECCVRGDWEFCRRSRYHPQHDLHECPVSRIRILTSKITQVCQDIRDIRLRQLLITRSDNKPNSITSLF